MYEGLIWSLYEGLCSIWKGFPHPGQCKWYTSSSLTQLSQYNWVGEPILDNSKLVLQLNGPLDSWSPIQLVSQLTGPQLKWWVLHTKSLEAYVGVCGMCGCMWQRLGGVYFWGKRFDMPRYPWKYRLGISFQKTTICWTSSILWYSMKLSYQNY